MARRNESPLYLSTMNDGSLFQASTMNLGRIVPFTFVQAPTVYLSTFFRLAIRVEISAMLPPIFFFSFSSNFSPINLFLLFITIWKKETRKIYLRAYLSEGKQEGRDDIYIYQSKKLIPGINSLSTVLPSAGGRFCHSKRPPPYAQQQDCARKEQGGIREWVYF